jgi:hypothetical protein
LNHRLIWSFQEISSGVVLAFNFGDTFDDYLIKGNYYLTMLHPSSENIKRNYIVSGTEDSSKNVGRFLDRHGKLIFTKCEDRPYEITIPYMILPYQGFEVYNVPIPLDTKSRKDNVPG